MVAYHKDLVDKITKLAIDTHIFLAADSQSSSQSGDIGRFKSNGFNNTN